MFIFFFLTICLSRASLIEERHPCDPDEIVTHHGYVFDCIGHEIEDLSESPLHDAEGNDLVIDLHSAGGGILFDLEGASALFHSEDEDEEEPMMLCTYPQAYPYLPQYGHIQSTGTI